MVDEEEDGAYHLLYTKAWDDDVGINWVSIDLDANSPTVNSSLSGRERHDAPRDKDTQLIER